MGPVVRGYNRRDFSRQHLNVPAGKDVVDFPSGMIGIAAQLGMGKDCGRVLKPLIDGGQDLTVRRQVEIPHKDAGACLLVQLLQKGAHGAFSLRLGQTEVADIDGETAGQVQLCLSRQRVS